MVEGLVSVIMPGYNCSRTVERAIESLLAQGYENWELIYVDDKSDDDSVVVVESIKDSRIKVIVMESNSGTPVIPRNIAIGEAKGQYIAFLDSDDMWHRDKLSTQINAMRKSGAFACHAYYQRVNQHGEVLNLVKSPQIVTYKMMLSTNYIGNLTGIYDCSKLGKFFQKRIGHEDYLMWLEILSKTDSVGVRFPLGCYTVSTSSVSSNKFKAMKWHYNVLRKELGFSNVKAFGYFLRYVFNAFLKRL